MLFYMEGGVLARRKRSENSVKENRMSFFPDYSGRDKVISYSVLGGIPHYLKQWDQKLSVAENIKRNILTKGCILYSEVDFLLHQELRETSVYNSVIEVVALGNTTLNSISQKSLMEDTSKTSVYLKNLIELGIVQREFSVDTKGKERANGNRGIYRLTDNFFRFWYAFVFANFSQLEDGDVDGVYEYIVEPALHEFAARNSYRLRSVNFCKISCRCYRNYCGEIGVMVTLK